MTPELEGIIVPVITPFRVDGGIDVPAYKKILHHLLEHRMNAIFCTASTGETANLSLEDRCRLIRHTTEFVNGKVPILVGAMETSLEHVLKVDALAAEIGAACIVLTAPYYFPLTDAELVDYFTTVAGKTKLPILLYNIPQLVKSDLNVGVLRRLAQVEKIIGLKDTSGKIVNFWRAFDAIRPVRPEFKFFIGLDDLVVDTLTYGADGAIPGGPNVHPALFADTWKAARTSDTKALQDAKARIAVLTRIFALAGDSFSSYLRGLKTAMHLLGLCENVYTPPFTPPDAETVEKIKKTLADLGLRV